MSIPNQKILLSFMFKTISNKLLCHPILTGFEFFGGMKNSQHCEMEQNCCKNTLESLETHQNSINSPLNTTKDQSVPEKTEYDDYIVKQAKKLYKNQKVSPEEINLRYDALKRKDMFKEITDINFNTFVAYRHLIAIAITFENDHGKSVDHYLKKYGLF